MVDYKSTFLLLSLSRYLCWWTISLRCYYYRWVNTFADGPLIYVFITITGSIPLLMDHSSTFSLLSLGQHLCWWTISLRFYYYHWVNTSAGGQLVSFLLLSLGQYLCWWTINLRFVLLSLGQYPCWWTISLRFYYYHWVNTSAEGPLIYVFITITGSIHLLVDYKSTFLLLSLSQYLCWWTISLRFNYYNWVNTSAEGPLIYVFITITGSIPLLVDYKSTFLLLSLGQYICWWTINLRFYYYHWVNTSTDGPLIYVVITITGSIPLLVDYKSTFLLLSLGQYLCWWTISLRFHYYHWINTSAVGL
jgi:uncharacterized membrane protein